MKYTLLLVVFALYVGADIEYVDKTKFLDYYCKQGKATTSEKLAYVKCLQIYPQRVSQQ